MYRLTMCENYIVQKVKGTYKILVGDLDWKPSYEDSRMPTINPYYPAIEKRVMLNMLLQMKQESY